MRLSEPATDLGAAVAIASSFKGERVDPTTAVVGEIGLSGELRSVSQLDRRLSEVGNLGFKRMVVPATVGRRGTVRLSSAVEVVRVSTVSEAIDAALGRH